MRTHIGWLGARIWALGRSAAGAARSFRGFPWTVTAALCAGIVGIAAIAMPGGSTAAGHHHSVAPGESTVLSTARSGTSLRPLPHGETATAGVTPFSAPPPPVRRGHGARVPVSSGVPAVALEAYERAAFVMLLRDPACHLSWADVAGIGRVESDNGLTWGSAARITRNGTLVPPIFGIPLDGQDGTPAMPAPGGGWVRAEGPMQFLPATWAEYAQDGNGDGKKNPQNFYDAALTTAVFLCANGGNLSVGADLDRGILAYNDSASYLSLVRSWIEFYTRAGTAALQAAGVGLLPVGAASTTSTRTPPTTKESPAARLAAAAAAVEATGSYEFTMTALAPSGSALATGSGGVDVRNGSAWVELRTSEGAIGLRVIGAAGYLDLPSSLDKVVGAEGTWIRLSSTVVERLPSPFGTALAAAASELPWLVGQLESCTRSMTSRLIASRTQTIAYTGQVDLGTAAETLAGAAASLRSLSSLIQSSYLDVVANVRDQRVQSATLTFWGLGQGRIGVHIGFGGFGSPVDVTTPKVSPVSSGGTTTTTTTSTTTTSSTTTTTTTQPVPSTTRPPG